MLPDRRSRHRDPSVQAATQNVDVPASGNRPEVLMP